MRLAKSLGGISRRVGDGSYLPSPLEEPYVRVGPHTAQALPEASRSDPAIWPVVDGGVVEIVTMRLRSLSRPTAGCFGGARLHVI